MNLVKSSTRTLNGPSIKDFDPEPAIIHWLNNAQRKRHIGGHKTKEQLFYNTYMGCTGEEPYQCIQYDKAYTDNMFYNIYMGYTGEEPYQCIQYDKTYSDNIFVNTVHFCKYCK